ncbi:hypothetical protein DPX16_15600 [Anabarilius grahami]|uniref:Uncharacterized protein n=1 Tax=Anabarilius grahami TaxID=495550 RepID=A0A3N0Z6S5_ANAGA|nr:hypothetical protein DPX16_15600 [Anabarilius grahami]
MPRSSVPHDLWPSSGESGSSGAALDVLVTFLDCSIFCSTSSACEIIFCLSLSPMTIWNMYRVWWMRVIGQAVKARTHQADADELVVTKADCGVAVAERPIRMIRWPDGPTSSEADLTFRIGRKKADEDQLQPTVRNTLRKLSRPTNKNCPMADRRLVRYLVPGYGAQKLGDFSLATGDTGLVWSPGHDMQEKNSRLNHAHDLLIRSLYLLKRAHDLPFRSLDL